MRRAKEDFLDVIAIGKGLMDIGIKLDSLAVLHAVSGSDQSSFFYNIGKKTAWNTYLLHHVSSYLIDFGNR